MKEFIGRVVKNIRNKSEQLWKYIIKSSESFGTKMYLGNLFVLLIGIGIVFVCFTAYNVTTLYENIQKDMQVKAENTLRGIEARINMLDTISIQLSSSPVIIDAMKEADDNEGNDFIYDVQTSYEIYEYLWSYIIDRDSANSITIYNNSGDYLYTGEGMTFSSEENVAVETDLLLEYVDGIETLFAQNDAFS